jgi:2-methylaconitate cis-trans-isomerase PrpF
MAHLLSKSLFKIKPSQPRASLATVAIPAIDISPLPPIWSPNTIFPMTAALDLPPKRLRHRHRLPASLMRAGTSRGLFIHRKFLPESQDDWKPWILAAMGSKNNDARQIDGVGGATSTTSKVCVVAPSNRPGIDVDYTFVQVAVGKESLDFSGNCGNMASGIGPFAVEEGLVKAAPGQTRLDVSIYNTNTAKRIVETVEIDDDGQYYDEGEYLMPGVKSPGSEVKVAFVDPAGSMTGKLFPTGLHSEELPVNSPRNGVPPFVVHASMVDAANPFVIVDQASMPEFFTTTAEHLELVEDIRRAGAVRMGLACDTESAALVKGTPKLAFVSSVPEAQGTPSADAFVASMSMQKPHPSLQLTGAVCIGAAACIPGTVVYDAVAVSRHSSGMSTPTSSDGPGSDQDDVSTSSMDMEFPGVTKKVIRLAHASGVLEVDVKLRADLNGKLDVQSCSVSRTARKIFDGTVLVNI